jgi:predicted ATPase
MLARDLAAYDVVNVGAAPSTILAERRGPVVRIRNKANDWNIVTQDLSPFDTMMMQAADPQDAPEMLTLRESDSGMAFL